MNLSSSSTVTFTPIESRLRKAFLLDIPAASTSMAETPRYSKRKRYQVTYNEIDENEFLLPSDAEEEYEPKAKKPRISSKPLPKHKIFPFIYQGVSDDDEEKSPARHMNSFAPNLLAVSKTVYAEAASFLYGQRISLADNYTLLSFLNQIGRQHTSMLREICVKEWCSGRAHRSINFPAMTLLASATNLELLDIDCAMGHFSSYGRMKLAAPTRAARKAFRDCYPWLEAIGKVKGKPDAAIDMIKVHPSNFAMRTHHARATGQDEEKLRENLAVFQKELRRLLRT
ncbi:hypothetical protein Vi05172_g5326 [Venturia inaequalis]|nr:hypothetical protein Vi05172_g5326 [Venturia inaequalis]